MSHSAKISIDYAKEVENESKRIKENIDKNNKIIKEKFLNLLYIIKSKNLENQFSNEIKDIEFIIKSGFAYNALEKINILNNNVEITANKLNDEIRKKEILKSKVETVMEEIFLNISKEEEIYFTNIIKKIEDLKLKIDKSNTDIDELINKELDELKKCRSIIFNKLDKVDSYVSALKGYGFTINDIRYNSLNNKFFIYAEKGGKYYDTSIDNNMEAELHFEGYSGDQCKKELEKLAEYAEKYHNLSTKLKNYEGKPIEKYFDAVNKSRY